jgi:hypothetical protein
MGDTVEAKRGSGGSVAGDKIAFQGFERSGGAKDPNAALFTFEAKWSRVNSRGLREGKDKGEGMKVSAANPQAGRKCRSLSIILSPPGTFAYFPLHVLYFDPLAPVTSGP